MIEPKYIKTQLFKTWEPFAELAGENVLEKVVDSKLDGKTSDKILRTVQDDGMPFDLGLALKIIGTATTILKTIIDSIKLYQDYSKYKIEILRDVRKKIETEIPAKDLADALEGKNIETITEGIAKDFTLK